MRFEKISPYRLIYELVLRISNPKRRTGIEQGGSRLIDSHILEMISHKLLMGTVKRVWRELWTELAAALCL